MPLMVDPNKDAGGGGIHPGRKLAQGVGLQRFTARTGTPMLAMGFVVLKDANPQSDDVGEVFLEMFPITERAVFRIAGWAQAQGWTGQFDAESDDDVEKIMGRGPVVAELKEETYINNNGQQVTRAKVHSFAKYNSSEEDPAWEALITKGEAAFDRILDAMNLGGGSSSRSSSGGSADPGSYSQNDDDIPF